MTLSRSFVLFTAMLASFVFTCLAATNSQADQRAKKIVETVGSDVGIVAVIDWPGPQASSVMDLLQDNHFKIYFQSLEAKQVDQVQQLAAKAGVLGSRIFAASGKANVIGLADNLADFVLVAPSATATVSDKEVLRVLHPRATAWVGDRKLVKPVPEGIDEWTHPYHGPDNNPQSKDQLVRGEFRTQFIARPKFSPMPEQTVAAGGRIFKALGHIAHKQNQNPHLNTLLCINAFNGMILWKRPLPKGFMIHRNTMIATADALYMGDHESCKVIDAKTGKVREQITVDEKLVDGPVWKWMAMRDGVLYGLVGNKEIQVDTQRAVRRGLGHWPWGMWKGHDYNNPRLSFGFGRTFVAIDLKTKKLKWHFRTDLFLDARAVAMNSKHIFAFSPGKALLAINLRDGKEVWKQEEGKALDAVGPNQRAQHYVTGYATTCYMKCNEDYLFFAGPQRKQMAVLSTKNGELAWTHPDGNLQLVLRDDAIYAAGPKSTGAQLDYKTGQKIASIPTRRACTRATGGVDSIFYRARGGTVRLFTDSNTVQHIAAMRPPCQDGVIISNGHLYWGPWMCGCQLSLYGNIGLGPVGSSYKTDWSDRSLYASARVTHVPDADLAKVQALGLKPRDWPAYRGGNSRNDNRGNLQDAKLPEWTKLSWKATVSTGLLPTAPVAGGGLVFVADRSGAVQAIDAQGKPVWKRFTSGPVYFPPAIAKDRIFVGSADGRVYAYEARTGRLLWTFRVAPEERRIYVFGQLISRWPVAGGVVVQDDTVYAVAGITNYDGTFVVALDATTGELKAQNSTSGKLAPEVNGGISLQGNLMIDHGELRFLGGGVYEIARYDLKTLKCLNTPANTVNSGTQTAFYPYYPKYGKFVSLQQTCADGVLCFAASYEGNAFGSITLQAPPEGKAKVQTGEEARVALRRRARIKPAKKLWQDAQNRRFTAFVVAKDMLIATGHTQAQPDAPFLVAIRIKDGMDLWQQELPADAVKGGIAVDDADRIFVSLENGQLLCFVPAKAPKRQASKDKPAPPTETKIEFIGQTSMKLYDKGAKFSKLPQQQTDDALGPFEGKGVYFKQRNGLDTSVSYKISSAKPVREIHFKGAATDRMTMEILDLEGKIVFASSGPFRRGNVYSEHKVKVPAKAGQRFILRFRNHTSTWFYIEKLTLK